MSLYDTTKIPNSSLQFIKTPQTIVDDIMAIFCSNNYTVSEAKKVLEKVNYNLDNQRITINGYSTYYGNYQKTRYGISYTPSSTSRVLNVF